jgi:hypothetical protein
MTRPHQDFERAEQRSESAPFAPFLWLAHVNFCRLPLQRQTWEKPQCKPQHRIRDWVLSADRWSCTYALFEHQVHYLLPQDYVLKLWPEQSSGDETDLTSDFSLDFKTFFAQSRLSK